MAPFDTEPIKSLSSRGGDPVSSDPGTMDRHTVIDVVVITGKFASLRISMVMGQDGSPYLSLSRSISPTPLETLRPLSCFPPSLLFLMINTETTCTTVIFLALLLSLYVFAWHRPTSLRSLRAIPVHGTSSPTPNTATHVRSTAIPRHNVAYSRRLWAMLVLFYHWWGQASHTGIHRASAVNIVHHEPTVFRVAPLSAQASSAGMGTELYTRSPSFTTFAPTSISGAPSIINTIVDNEAMELHVLGGIKGPSTSSLAVTDNADTTDTQYVVLSAEPIAHVDVGAVTEATKSSSTTIEVDVTEVDKVARGSQALR
ncbi:hypothetical protein DFH29DRAFT_1083071 [Suillus ampliporus]|nr:hypothetical protein DFH29DRAFT_1083071 [Suillus ampliporus]